MYLRNLREKIKRKKKKTKLFLKVAKKKKKTTSYEEKRTDVQEKQPKQDQKMFLKNLVKKSENPQNPRKIPEKDSK